MSLSGFLKDTVSITRQSESISGKQKVMTSATVSASASCLIQPISGTLAMSILGRYPSAVNIIFFDSSQDIKENDILNDGTDDYMVLNVDNVDRPGTLHHKEAIVELRKG